MLRARIWASVGLLLLVGCSASNGDNSGTSNVTPSGGHAGKSSGGGSGATTSGGDTQGGTLNLGGDVNGGSAAMSGGGSGGMVDMSGCGDGIIQSAKLGEVCDDGNSMSGDGCSADCKVVEVGYSCLKPGKPCESTVKCGDGMLGGTETCDDGNAVKGDGCDDKCMLEAGWICPTQGDLCVAAKCGDGIIAGVEQCEDDDGATPMAGDGCDANCAIEAGWVCDAPGKACRKAVCGDGVVEGGEPCDDKNTVIGDGCSPGCVAEPICTKPTAVNGCTSSCGDGILLAGDPNEQCDDGNKRDGDGCSSTCQVEPGYKCDAQVGALPPTLTIPFVFRDMISLPSKTTTHVRHPDFEHACLNQQVNNIAADVLDKEGKPQNSGLHNDDAACTLNVGYVDQGAGFNNCAPRETCPGNIEQLHVHHQNILPVAGDPFKFWYRTTDQINIEKETPITLTLANGKYSYDSGGLYPLDGDGWVKSGDEQTYNGHNYGFTTEIRRWFELKGGEILTFSGDDDVWVFINGKLALDIGGSHGLETRTIRLNANGSVDCKKEEPLPAMPPAAAVTFADLVDCATPNRALGLQVGKVYEIALFHAERHTSASNFRLALTGFVSAKSVCSPVCGDGVQTPGEQCDDGKLDGSYGGCAPGCKRGPRCGDGMVQMPQEECDDGKNLTPYSATKTGCAPGCKLPNYCGDGMLDSLFGEQCDDGTNAGGYGGCNKDCTLGPRCGDGHIDEPTENCDDGNAVSGDGCSAKCVKEMPK